MMISPKTRLTPTDPSAPSRAASVTIAPQPANTSANAARLSAIARRTSPGRCSITAPSGRRPGSSAQPCLQRREAVGPSEVVRPQPTALAADDAGADQHLQVLRQRLLAHVEERRQLALAQRLRRG